MHDLFRIALQGMQQDSHRLTSISRNVANVNTPGYQRQVYQAPPIASATFASLWPAIESNGAAKSMETASAPGLLDQSAGAFKTTQEALDFALIGPGYFVVKAPDGLAYTRSGQFRRDPQDRLVNLQGYPVMGEQGEIRLLPGRNPELDRTGALMVGEGLSAIRFQVAQFAPSVVMTRRADGLLSADAAAQNDKGDLTSIHQGQLEQSNVNLLSETLATMQTMRHFESMQRIVQISDDMLATCIRKLGEA